MGNNIRQWLFVKGLEWAVKEAMGKDIMKTYVPQLIKKIDIDKDIVKSQLISLFEDWIREVREI